MTTKQPIRSGVVDFGIFIPHQTNKIKVLQPLLNAAKVTTAADTNTNNDIREWKKFSHS